MQGGRARMPWDGDIAHTKLGDGRVVLRGSQEEADYKFWRNGVGNCIICAKPAIDGTRYCGGERGCTHGP